MKIMKFLLILCCISPTIKSYQVNLSFDSLFPMTWYQKGLESSLSVWQTLINVFDKNNDEILLSFDSLLGRLAFAQFCINRMNQEGTPCIADDSAYFSAVLYKLKQLFAAITITPKSHDFVLCADDMIEAMEKKLKNAQ